MLCYYGNAKVVSEVGGERGMKGGGGGGGGSGSVAERGFRRRELVVVGGSGGSGSRGEKLFVGQIQKIIGMKQFRS